LIGQLLVFVEDSELVALGPNDEHAVLDFVQDRILVVKPLLLHVVLFEESVDGGVQVVAVFLEHEYD